MENRTKFYNMFANSNFCRVCGFDNGSPMWGDDGKTPNYEICDCCGVEFGYEDYTIESLHSFRSKWIDKGTPWFNKKSKPENWDFKEQFKNVPEEYR